MHGAAVWNVWRSQNPAPLTFSSGKERLLNGQSEELAAEGINGCGRGVISSVHERRFGGLHE
jgi:hypothetical protein